MTGSFAEKEVPESDENTEVIDWKQLAKELEEERDGLQNKDEGKSFLGDFIKRRSFY